MDGIRGEVSNKIRSAIKAKLMELGAYVDDELPDYIMVMVANKRSRQQMDDDLLLFLGDSTLTFTAWLHTVLSKLQQVTVNSVELKKGSEKKRSYEDPKKEKKKKMKKEKDKSPEKSKVKEKTSEERRELSPTISQTQSKPIKAEPIDLIEDEDSLLNESQPSLSHKESSSANPIVQPAGKKVSEQKLFEEEEDDDDFINLKADAEADMWGEAEENSNTAVKSSVAPEPAPAVISLKSSQSKLPETEDQSKQSSTVFVKSTPNITAVKNTTAPSPTASSSKSAPESKPAPRIIKISETIRQEQESLKQSAKPPREPQTLVKRVFQSHIVSQKNTLENSKKSRGQSSSLGSSENHNRRTESRSSRRYEQEDLRQTLRKERQRERDHGRERDREQRRSKQQTPPRKLVSGVSSIVRSTPNEEGFDASLKSAIRVKPRPQLPANLQANRSLILKAVAEAQKSVSKVVVRSEVTTPKVLDQSKPNANRRASKELLSSRKEHTNLKYQQSSAKKEQFKLKQASSLPSRETLKKMSFTVLGNKSAPREESSGAELCGVSDDGSIILDPSLNILIQVPASPAEEAAESPDPVKTEKVRRWIKDVEEADRKSVV